VRWFQPGYVRDCQASGTLAVRLSPRAHAALAKAGLDGEDCSNPSWFMAAFPARDTGRGRFAPHGPERRPMRAAGTGRRGAGCSRDVDIGRGREGWRLPVSGHAVAVEVNVAGGQQRGAGALALAAGAHGQDRQVLVGHVGRMVVFQRLVEDGEPAGPRCGCSGQPLAVAGRRAGGTGPAGSHNATASRPGVVCTSPAAIACATSRRKYPGKMRRRAAGSTISHRDGARAAQAAAT
jgi:hypothetical protein